MKKYKLVKYVYGNSIKEVLDVDNSGEIIYIDLQEEENKKEVGFNNKQQDE